MIKDNASFLDSLLVVVDDRHGTNLIVDDPHDLLQDPPVSILLVKVVNFSDIIVSLANLMSMKPVV